MDETILIEGIYTLHEKLAEGGMAIVYRAEVDLVRFDYRMLYAYTQVQGRTHAERRRNAEDFVNELADKPVDLAAVRGILEAHRIMEEAFQLFCQSRQVNPAPASPRTRVVCGDRSFSTTLLCHCRSRPWFWRV